MPRRFVLANWTVQTYNSLWRTSWSEVPSTLLRTSCSPSIFLGCTQTTVPSGCPESCSISEVVAITWLSTKIVHLLLGGPVFTYEGYRARCQRLPWVLCFSYRLNSPYITAVLLLQHLLNPFPTAVSGTFMSTTTDERATGHWAISNMRIGVHRLQRSSPTLPSNYLHNAWYDLHQRGADPCPSLPEAHGR